MQLDPAFAERLRRREAEAERSTQLEASELACLRGADPAAISADRGGRRVALLLRNVSGEFALSLAVSGTAEWLESFPASAHFHRAISEDTSLPLAFAAHVAEQTAHASAMLGSLIELESALARARRALRQAPECPGSFALAPSAWLVELALGTFEWASALRLAIDRGSALPIAPPRREERETVLVAGATSGSGSRLRAVRAECLTPSVADFLRACLGGLDAAALATFCETQGVERAVVDAVLSEFIAEGVLLETAQV